MNDTDGITDDDLTGAIVRMVDAHVWVHRPSIAFNVLTSWLPRPLPSPGTTPEDRARNLAWMARFQSERVEPIVTRLLSTGYAMDDEFLTRP